MDAAEAAARQASLSEAALRARVEEYRALERDALTQQGRENATVTATPVQPYLSPYLAITFLSLSSPCQGLYQGPYQGPYLAFI